MFEDERSNTTPWLTRAAALSWGLRFSQKRTKMNMVWASRILDQADTPQGKVG